MIINGEEGNFVNEKSFEINEKFLFISLHWESGLRAENQLILIAKSYSINCGNFLFEPQAIHL